MSHDPRAVSLGFDIGGTNLRAATVSSDGSILQRRTAPNPAPRGAGPDAAGRLVEAIVHMARDLGPDLPIGIGIASLVDRAGRLLGGPNIGVADMALGARLEAAVGRPVVVVNDASAAAWGEFRAGGGRDVDDLVLLTLGTGVGGGVVVDGRLLVGAGGIAGELGHVVVQGDGGRPCPCGGRGHLESYAAGRAFGEIAAERVASGAMTGAVAQASRIDGAAVTRAAAAGDEPARELLAEAGIWLARGIASLVNVFDPGLVLVGGGAGQAAGPWLLPAAREALVPDVIERERRTLPEVRLAELGDDAGVVGAALLAES